MNPEEINDLLETVLEQYRQSFASKSFAEESPEEDDLMLVFGLTQRLKAENKQYWGRELGMCWQRLIANLCSHTCENFSGPIKEDKDEICDLVIGKDAIDTKYRIGSGDSGTLKKFRQYAARLRSLGYNPVLLILRTDNLPQAITACASAGWDIKIGSDAYDYVHSITGFDLRAWLKEKRNAYTTKL
ncbi:MAG: restriction endonuclease [Acidobacteriota bacterium]